MTLPAVLRPEARDDLIAAHDWYEQQRPGLGRSFADAVAELLAKIKDHPELYERALGDLRRARLRRFPYVVYFRILADRVEVVAILHGSRDSGVWRGRA